MNQRIGEIGALYLLRGSVPTNTMTVDTKTACATVLIAVAPVLTEVRQDRRTIGR